MKPRKLEKRAQERGMDEATLEALDELEEAERTRRLVDFIVQTECPGSAPSGKLDSQQPPTIDGVTLRGPVTDGESVSKHTAKNEVTDTRPEPAETEQRIVSEPEPECTPRETRNSSPSTAAGTPLADERAEEQAGTTTAGNEGVAAAAAEPAAGVAAAASATGVLELLLDEALLSMCLTVARSACGEMASSVVRRRLVAEGPSRAASEALLSEVRPAAARYSK